MLKDEMLDWLAERGANVAQFVSWGPDGSQRFTRISGISSDSRFTSIGEAAIAIYEKIETPSVNLRTFLPDKPDGNPFEYGLMDPRAVEEKVTGYINQGFHVIINETIRVNDGGFSGVLLGYLMEGAPNETPRCVEKPGCMRLPRKLGFKLIQQVYGFHFHLPFAEDSRVEFSVHPHRVGYNKDFLVIWQEETYQGQLPSSPKIFWPNKYSQIIGDKAFGLLIGDLIGMPVPRTTVFGRHIPQFTFGTPTNSGEPIWIRSAPKIQAPGQFTTRRGHADPFAIMQQEDPDATKIAAILFADGVTARYSGSAITDKSGQLIVEGCESYGDRFMIGTQSPEPLPERVKQEVKFLSSRLREELGDVRFEWVYDGEKPWLVQLHIGRVETFQDIIYPGKPKRWITFGVENGLEGLRKTVDTVKNKNVGITLVGDVGLTSHFGDILRKAKIPSRLRSPKEKKKN